MCIRDSLGVGPGPCHRLAVRRRVLPLLPCVGGVAEVEGDLAEDLEALLGGERHPRALHLDGLFGHLGQALQPIDLRAQLPLPRAQLVQGVGLRVAQDEGDLVEREAQFAVEEDLLEPGQVGVAVGAVAGAAAFAG